jgi:hypothetical protein
MPEAFFVEMTLGNVAAVAFLLQSVQAFLGLGQICDIIFVLM